MKGLPGRFDPLPAGLEAMNPALAVTGTVPEDTKDNTKGGWWWRSTWFEHQNLRDEGQNSSLPGMSLVAGGARCGLFCVTEAKEPEAYEHDD